MIYCGRKHFHGGSLGVWPWAIDLDYLLLKGIGLKILRRNMSVLYWMMLGYVIVDLDDVNVVLGGCEL